MQGELRLLPRPYLWPRAAARRTTRGAAGRRSKGWPQAGAAAREPTGPDRLRPAWVAPWGLHLLPHANPAS